MGACRNMFPYRIQWSARSYLRVLSMPVFALKS